VTTVSLADISQPVVSAGSPHNLALVDEPLVRRTVMSVGTPPGVWKSSPVVPAGTVIVPW
jgi:hypothetical protein